MRTKTYRLTGPLRWPMNCLAAIAMFGTGVSAQQADSISGMVHKLGGIPVSHVEVRIEGAGATLTSDSGEFLLAMTPNLHVGMAAVFHVKDWVVIKPCELKSGRTYLRDPSEEPIEFFVLARGDPSLKSAKTNASIIGCLLEEKASEFAPRSKAVWGPRVPLLQGRHPLFAVPV